MSEYSNWKYNCPVTVFKVGSSEVTQFHEPELYPENHMYAGKPVEMSYIEVTPREHITTRICRHCGFVYGEHSSTS